MDANAVMRYLTPDLKRDIVMQRLWAEGAPLTSKVMVSLGRTETDFEVHRKGDAVQVIFSLPFNSPRFGEVMGRLAVAVTLALKESKPAAMSRTDFHCVECGADNVWLARKVLVCVGCGCTFKVQVLD